MSTTTTTTKGSDGKMHTVTATTLAIFPAREGHGGEYIDGEQITGSGARVISLSASQADIALGSRAFNSAQAQSAAASAPGFFTITGRDMEAHPGRYIFAGVMAVGTAYGVFPPFVSAAGMAYLDDRDRGRPTLLKSYGF